MSADMPIGALAARAGASAKTIRYYEAIDLLPQPCRTPAGHRRYSGADAERLTFIKNAQRLGLALDEIRKALELRDRGQRPCGYVRGVIRHEVEHIDRRIAELTQLRAQLLAIDAHALPETESGTCRIIEQAPLITGRGTNGGKAREMRARRAHVS